MPLVEHLTELRDRLIRIIVFGVIGCALFRFRPFGMLVSPMNAALERTGRGTMAVTEPLKVSSPT